MSWSAPYPRSCSDVVRNNTAISRCLGQSSFARSGRYSNVQYCVSPQLIAAAAAAVRQLIEFSTLLCICRCTNRTSAMAVKAKLRPPPVPEDLLHLEHTHGHWVNGVHYVVMEVRDYELDQFQVIQDRQLHKQNCNEAHFASSSTVAMPD